MIKKFNIKDIDVFIRGCQEKGIYTEQEKNGSKKIFYVKTENAIEKGKDPKISMSKHKDMYNNMILFECLTSKIFQKLGIDTLQYHFGRIEKPNNPLAWLPAVYSESFVSEDENQFPLESIYIHDFYLKEGKKIISPSKLLRGDKLKSLNSSELFEASFITYVDENIQVIKNFFNRYQSSYPGGIYIDYDNIKSQLIMQLIGDMLCYNRDRHLQNVMLISKSNNTPQGKCCNIRLAPSFDFGYAFFSTKNQKHFHEEIARRGVPAIIDEYDFRFMSLTDACQRDAFEEFDLVQDYLLALKKQKHLSVGEKKIIRLIYNLKNISIEGCFKELFINELDGANNNMSMDELIFLYNKQMRKDIDMSTIKNVEKLFEYAKYFILYKSPYRKRSFSNIFEEKRPFSNIPPLIQTYDNNQEQPSNDLTINQYTSNYVQSMGEDE